MKNNLLQNLPDALKQEVIDELLCSDSLRIERIVSQGQKSADDFWYDQPENEWGIVLEGSAILEFEKEEIKLTAGDYLLIPSHKKHRVKWTDPARKTIWLAIFYK